MEQSSQKKLGRKDYIFIGSMLFGLFFGAGNLIFPIHMGQEAGAAIFQAHLGFLVTGVGFPFLGIIALGISQSAGVFELASRINRTYAYIFTVLLYLVLGPFFALPRLATTSFEIGISPFLPGHLQTPILALFSIVFFGAAWFLARKLTKLLDYIGKVLNPLFLVLLAVVLIGKGVSALQEAGMISLHLLNGFPRVELLGMYPTMETAGAQAAMIALLLAGFAYNNRVSFNRP